MYKSAFQKFAVCCLSCCLCLLLVACQDRTWHQQKLTVGPYQIEAAFPTAPRMSEQAYDLLDEQQEAPIQRVQWTAVAGQSSFNLSYLLVPEHLDPVAVAQALLRSMRLKRDPRLVSAPSEFVAAFEQDLPALGEEFSITLAVDSKLMLAQAKVLQQGQLIVQLYTTGAENDKNFLQQSRRFFEELKIGATID